VQQLLHYLSTPNVVSAGTAHSYAHAAQRALGLPEMRAMLSEADMLGIGAALEAAKKTLYSAKHTKLGKPQDMQAQAVHDAAKAANWTEPLSQPSAAAAAAAAAAVVRRKARRLSGAEAAARKQASAAAANARKAAARAAAAAAASRDNETAAAEDSAGLLQSDLLLLNGVGNGVGNGVVPDVATAKERRAVGSKRNSIAREQQQQQQQQVHEAWAEVQQQQEQLELWQQWQLLQMQQDEQLQAQQQQQEEQQQQQQGSEEDWQSVLEELLVLAKPENLVRIVTGASNDSIPGVLSRMTESVQAGIAAHYGEDLLQQLLGVLHGFLQQQELQQQQQQRQSQQQQQQQQRAMGPPSARQVMQGSGSAAAARAAAQPQPEEGLQLHAARRGAAPGAGTGAVLGMPSTATAGSGSVFDGASNGAVLHVSSATVDSGVPARCSDAAAAGDEAAAAAAEAEAEAAAALLSASSHHRLLAASMTANAAAAAAAAEGACGASAAEAEAAAALLQAAAADDVDDVLDAAMNLPRPTVQARQLQQLQALGIHTEQEQALYFYQ
jgi:hypothetical protein